MNVKRNSVSCVLTQLGIGLDNINNHFSFLTKKTHTHTYIESTNKDHLEFFLTSSDGGLGGVDHSDT